MIRCDQAPAVVQGQRQQVHVGQLARAVDGVWLKCLLSSGLMSSGQNWVKNVAVDCASMAVSMGKG